METIQIKVESRTATGKKANKELRNSGRIPAVLYGGGENLSFSTTHNEVKNLIYTPDFKLASIDIEGTAHQAILKEIQFHPVTDQIVHLDFIKLADKTPVKIQVPIRFKGVSPGVKDGGKLMQSVRKIGIKTIPEHIIDEIIADISEVQLGESIRVKDLEVGENIEVLLPDNIPVASVNIPRVLS